MGFPKRLIKHPYTYKILRSKKSHHHHPFQNIMSFKPKLHVTGIKGRNCIQSAVLGGKTDTLEYLHSLDNSLRYHKDNDGNTAMTLAVLHSNLETVKCLVEKLEL